MRYLPWGGTCFASGQTLTSYKFTGRREEAGQGLYDYGAQWYDPSLGRFIGCPPGADILVPNSGDIALETILFRTRLIAKGETILARSAACLTPK